MPTPFRVARRATRVGDQGSQTRPLAEWRELDAYVLLGDPGAGKSWAFEDECSAVSGVCLTARNVVAGITPTIHPDDTVFIDGLDEVRAGTADGRERFHAIRAWLHRNGRPRFRLSCREADWLGNIDRRHLEEVSPRHRIDVLHLEPLHDDDIRAIVTNRADAPDADAFLAWAEGAGLKDLLRNPLLLDLLLESYIGGQRPSTRAGIYEAACTQLVREHNEEHRAAVGTATVPPDTALDDAGLLSAILLLSGRRGFTLGAAPTSAQADDVHLEDLGLLDKRAVLGSKVFAAQAGLASPRHRSIAEYLAGRALARRVQDGLPLGRVMALMQGVDGVPVDPLRGVWAWLAAHHAPSRDRLIAIDPLGFVLNADAAVLGFDERLNVLRALAATANDNAWFRKDVWVSHPFGPLAKADMAETYARVLADSMRDPGHLAFMRCVLDALTHGDAMPSLASALEAWVEDASAPDHLRVAAYRAWKNCVGALTPKMLAWLDAIKDDRLIDANDGLSGALLRDLYPAHVSPDRVFDYWHVPKDSSYYGLYRDFWDSALWVQTPRGSMSALAQAWARVQHTDDEKRRDGNRQMSDQLLEEALRREGDLASDETLFDWLGLCLDEHGFSRFRSRNRFVQDWLSQRPHRMKAVVALGHARPWPHANLQGRHWLADARLHGAKKPRDWLFWLLDCASKAETADLAHACFFSAAHAVMDPNPDFDTPTMEDIASWVDEHKGRWSQAEQWQSEAWSIPIDDWRGDDFRYRSKAQAIAAEKLEKRRLDLAPHLPSLLEGTAPDGLLYYVAMAHDHGFSDLQGTTPLDRVRNYLGVDDATAHAVIAALPKVLGRTNLPTSDEALALHDKGRQHYVRPAALLAARVAHEQDADAPLNWPDPLVERLAAYYLTDGTGELPAWYRMVVLHRPSTVAPVVIRYLAPRLRRKTKQHLTGIWALGTEADHAALARLVLPPILESLPTRLGKAARGHLNTYLLAALHVLEPDRAARIVSRKLQQDAMDPAQRICWLVADLPYRATAANELATLVARNERRATVLGEALQHQKTLERIVERLSPRAIGDLISLLAPISQPAWRTGTGWVTPSDERNDTVHGLFRSLSSNPSPDARAILLDLVEAPGTQQWRETAQFSLHAQAAVARAASFVALTPGEIASVLQTCSPANHADLRALVVDHLEDLERTWRHADTFFLKDFWRDERGGNESKSKHVGRQPRIENECRDRILERLRDRLRPLHILVSRERTTAQDKQADMWVEFIRDARQITLPIEVKKENHDKLWTACRDQLQRLYSGDPTAGGFGLYLVLWFGVKTTTHPEGLKPRDPVSLHAALVDRIPPQDRHRLVVQVLDLSWPAAERHSQVI
jgi:hypothetical protein